MRLFDFPVVGLVCIGLLPAAAFPVPFSFAEIETVHSSMPSPEFVTATDGMRLAVFPFRATRPSAALLFLHGGGAHSGAGYADLATGLRERGISTYLMDLRGHGLSDGQRGDSPSVEQMFRDISSVLKWMRPQSRETRIVLGGHSSGGGLTLNYASWPGRENVNGYLFLAPEFGYRSDTARPGREEFAAPRLWVFLGNALTGGRVFSHMDAVHLNYPGDILRRDPRLLRDLSCNMALAITPAHPREQFAALDRPFVLLVGAQDELFSAEQVVAYGSLPAPGIRSLSTYQMLPGLRHLSVLLGTDAVIAGAIEKLR